MAKKKPKTKTAVDEIGRTTSKEAQEIYDAKSQTDNYANNKRISEMASKYVADHISRIELSRTGLEDKFAVLYGLWNGDSISDYFPTSRGVHVPEPFKAVEGFVPRAAETLVEQPGWFRVVGVDDAGKRNAEIIEKLLLAQLKRDGFNSKFRAFLRDCAIYGYAPGKVRWKKRRRKIKYNQVIEEPAEPEGGTGEKLTLKTGVETEVNLDGPTLEHVDVYDFFVDLRYRDIQEAPGIIFRQIRSEDELLSMRDSGDYENVDKLIDNTPGADAGHSMIQGPPGTLSNPSTFQDLRNLQDGVSIDTMTEKVQYREYEIYEFWGRFDKDYDPTTGERGEEKECVITLGRKAYQGKAGNGWVCLRISENTYWHGMRPGVVAHYTRRSHCFQSIGLIEPIVSLCAELDDSRAMALAARALESKPVLIATDDADIYSNNQIIDPGTIIRARNADAVKALFIPKGSDSAYRAEDQIKGDIREVTGIISTYQGSSDSSSETATSVVNRTKEANKRIAETAKNIAEDFLVPMLEMFFSMDQQMLTKEKMVELIGEDGLTVDIRKMSPEEVAGRVSFEITALPEIEIAGLKSRMLISFLHEAQNWIPIDPEIIRPAELLKMAWTEMFGTANLGRIFPSADRPLKMRSATDEHYMFGMGHNPDVQEGENYQMHFKSHTGFTTSSVFAKWPIDAQRRLIAHIATTKTRLDAEIEQQSLRVPPEVLQQNMLAQMPPQQPGGPAGPQAGPQGQREMGVGAKPGAGGSPMGGMAMKRPGGMGPVTTTGQVRSAASANAPRTPKDDDI